MTLTPEELAEQWISDRCRLRDEDKVSSIGHLVDRELQVAYLAGYEEAKPQWISVEDALPEDNQDVLCMLRSRRNGETSIKEDYYIKGKSRLWHNLQDILEVIRWMPMPTYKD